MENKKLKLNFPLVYLFNATWSFLLIQSVVVPFFQSHSLSMSEVFLVITCFSVTLCLLDIPTGYLSDLLGRKETLILASLFKGVGGTVLAFSHEMKGFLSAYVFIGIGNSLYSGADVALLYETNEAIQDEKKEPLSQVFGKRIYFSQLGMVAASIIGGMLAAHSLPLTVSLNAVFAWLPLGIAFFFRNVPKTKTSRTLHKENLKQVFRDVFLQGPKARLLVLGAVFYSAIPVLAAFSFQGLWKSFHIPLAAFGYLFAFYNLAGALSGKKIGLIESKLGTHQVLLWVGGLATLGLLGNSIPVVGVALVTGVALEIVRGMGQATFLDKLNQNFTGHLRATANSVVSFLSRLLVAGLGPVLGAISDKQGFQMTFLVLGVLSILVLLFVCLPLTKGIKEEV